MGMKCEYARIGDVNFALLYTTPEIVIVEKITFKDDSTCDYPQTAQVLVKDIDSARNCLLVIALPEKADNQYIKKIKTSHEIMVVESCKQILKDSIHRYHKLALINLYLGLGSDNKSSLLSFMNNIDISVEEAKEIKTVAVKPASVSFVYDRDFFPRLFAIQTSTGFHPLDIDTLQRSDRDHNGSFVYRINYRNLDKYWENSGILWFVGSDSFYYMKTSS